jgi:hypothetical protein
MEAGVGLALQSALDPYFFFLVSACPICPPGELFYTSISAYRKVGEDWLASARREAREEIWRMSRYSLIIVQQPLLRPRSPVGGDTVRTVQCLDALQQMSSNSRGTVAPNSPAALALGQRIGRGGGLVGISLWP